MTYVELGPDEFRPVRVRLDDGRWCDGWLEGYRRVDGVWAGYVRYSTHPAETYLGWFEDPRIRGH